MYTTTTVKTPPRVEPAVLEIAKSHLRVDSGNEDELISGYLQAARSWAESFLGRALITQTLVYTMRRPHTYDRNHEWWGGNLFRRSHAIELPRSPVQSVSSVIYRDDTGVDFPINLANVLSDLTLEPARLQIDWSAVSLAASIPIAWPLQHIQITFVAGYGADGSFVPQPITNAILLLTAFLYEHRGDNGGEMPVAAERLLWMHRIPSFGG